MIKSKFIAGSLTAPHDLVPSFPAHLLLPSLYTLSPSQPGAFHLFLLPGVLPHPSTQCVLGRHPFLQEDFQPFRPRSKVPVSHLQAQLTAVSRPSRGRDFHTYSSTLSSRSPHSSVGNPAVQSVPITVGTQRWRQLVLREWVKVLRKAS